MYAVIFKAEFNKPEAMMDEDYLALAARLRTLAIDRYGCTEFNAVAQDGREIAISYWVHEADIMAWKQDVEHQIAQAKGREQWYRSYQVEIVRVMRQYNDQTTAALVD